MFCALLTSRYQVSVYRTNGPLVLKIFTKYSTHHSLSANTGFKSLAFILFEILHLQNCAVKFQNFQRAITKKKSYTHCTLSMLNSLYSITC